MPSARLKEGFGMRESLSAYAEAVRQTAEATALLPAAWPGLDGSTES